MGMFDKKDEEEEVIEPLAPQAQETIAAAPQPAPEVDYRAMLRQKLVDKYMPEQREKLVEENKKAGSGFNWRALAGGIGTSLQGLGAKGAQDILEQDEKKRQGLLDQFDKGKSQLSDDLGFFDKIEAGDRQKVEQERSDKLLAAKRDPNSVQTQFARRLGARLDPAMADDINKMTAEEIEGRFPILGQFFQANQVKEVKEMELGAKAREEQLKAMKEQEKISRAVGGNETRRQIFEKIPFEDKQKEAVKQLGQVQQAGRIGQRIVDIMNQKGSDPSLFDKAGGQKIKGEVMQEVRAYMMAAQKTPQEAEGQLAAIERFLDSNPNASKQDIQSMALGIVTNLMPTTSELDGYEIDYPKPLEMIKIPSGGAAPSGQSKAKESAPQAATVKRQTPDGKVAVYDAKTKKFLRYE